MLANIEIERAELIMPFRNFSGKTSKYNLNGERTFSVYIPDELVDTLTADGWNIKYSRPNEDGERRPYLNVTVNYKFRPPVIAMGTNMENMQELNEATVGELDWADILNVDLSIRPREYNVNGKSGIKAYLAEMYVIVQKSAFGKKYQINRAEEPQNDSTPF